MHENYIILRDELPTTEERITSFEETHRIKFPDDYRKFLLNYNGGVVVPNYPKSKNLKTGIFPIERFYSIQDIEFGEIYNQKEIRDYVKEDVENYGFQIEFGKLIFIGVCERGNIHLYCGENGYGEIYYSNYSGGEGLEKTGLSSFTELLNSLSSFDEDWKFDRDNPLYKNWQSDKIFTFDYYFYWSDDVKEQSLERFKEVLLSYGAPNKVHKFKKTDVVNYYLNYPVILKYLIETGATYPEKLNRVNNLESLKFLVSKGANVQGLLNTTINIETIKFLVEECNQDLNNPFEGNYPLLNLTNVEGVFSAHSRVVQYELIEDVLDLGYEVDLSIKDEKGRTIKERINLIKTEYDKHIEKYPYLGREK